MSPRNSEQFRQMRRSSREKILRTALELFGTRGYHTTSIEAIAGAAGVSKGLIYNYFSSKEQLLEALLVGSIDEMVELFSPLLEQPDPKRQMKLFVDGMIDFACRETQFWRLYWSLMSQPTLPEGIRGHVMEKMRGVVGVVRDVFERAGASDPSAEAWLFSAMLDGVILYYVMDPRHCPLERMRTVMYERYDLA